MAERIAALLYLAGFLTYYMALSEDDEGGEEVYVSFFMAVFWPVVPLAEALVSLWLYITGDR